MTAVAELNHDVPTTLGTYGPGTPVYPIERRKDGLIAICLDPGREHPGRCHAAAVPPSWLRPYQAAVAS